LEAYRIELFPTHNEITISGSIDTVKVKVILDELAMTPEFPMRDSIWIFDDDIVAPPFPEFERLIELARGYLHPDHLSKKVGLVVAGGLNRALVEMFRAEAVTLPLILRVFLSREEAVSWIEDGANQGNSPTA